MYMHPCQTRDLIAFTDLTKFYKSQHSDIQGADVTPEIMLELSGQDLTPYCESAYGFCMVFRFNPFTSVPVPLTLGCPGLVRDPSVSLLYANFTPVFPLAVHTSGVLQSVQTSGLRRQDWYTANFLYVLLSQSFCSVFSDE